MDRTAIPMWLMALTGVMFHSFRPRAAARATGTPGASLELDKDLPWLHGVAGVDVDPGDLAGDGRRDDGFHLHGLEHHQDVVDLDGLPDLGRDADDHARDGAAADLALVG